MENTKQTQYHAAAYVRLSKEDLNSVSGLKAEATAFPIKSSLFWTTLKTRLI